MLAELYISDDSFLYNSRMNKKDIQNRLKQLQSDIDYILTNYGSDNIIYVNNTIYNKPFYLNHSISYLINNKEFTIKEFDELFYRSLFSIINRPKQTKISTDEVIKILLKEHSADLCHGLIAFDEVSHINKERQIIIYTKNDWYKFRRYYLSLYPINGEYFIKECRKYFPKLFFHERNVTTVSCLLSDCSKKLVFYLSELNDKFEHSKTNPYNRKESLRIFNSQCSFDQDASDLGNSGSKKKSKKRENVKFKFLDNKGHKKDIHCDLHLKILKNDFGKVSTGRRIYFCEEDKDIAIGKILVGHMGGHR